MSIKLLGAASALALTFGLAGAAFADTVSSGGAGSSASSQENGNVSKSNNQANGNNNSKNVGITKTNTETNTKVIDSNNSTNKVNDSYNLSTEDSHNLSTEDSHNVKTTTITKTYNISKQELDGSVSDISFTGSSEGNGADPDNRSINTGGVSWNGNAFLGMAGIQTSSTNTGFGSLNQTSTMVSANANVTFGHN
jgi:hypothetical protein